VNWPLIGAILGGSALVAGALLFRRRQLQPVSPSRWRDSINPAPIADTLRETAHTGAATAIEEDVHFPADMRDAANTIGVHEHESAIDLAEIMLSFGRVKEAARTLEEFIQTNPKQSPEPWLKLIDIYRQAGMKTEFVETAQRFSKSFNASTAKWEQKDEENAMRSIADFPHLQKKIVDTWGTQECLNYLYLLLQEKRQGERAGFPLTVLDEVMTLVSILENDGSLTAPKKADELRQ